MGLTFLATDEEGKAPGLRLEGFGFEYSGNNEFDCIAYIRLD